MGRDYAKTKILKLGAMDLDIVNDTFKALETQAVKDLTEESIARSRIVLDRSVDMRYVGQSFELNIPCPNGQVDKSVIKSLEDLFVKKHEVVYGHSVVGEPMEIVNIRVSATGLVASPQMRKLAKPSDGVDRALKGRRAVYFRSIDKSLDSPIYLRKQTAPDRPLEGTRDRPAARRHDRDLSRSGGDRRRLRSALGLRRITDDTPREGSHLKMGRSACRPCWWRL